MESKNVTILLVVIALVAGIAWWIINGGWSEIRDRFFVETVYVDASHEEIVIDRPANTIQLTVNGDGNLVTVTKETRLSRLKANGNENVIKLCEGIHDPKMEGIGTNNKANFFSC
jgi:hypothetical protein